MTVLRVIYMWESEPPHEDYVIKTIFLFYAREFVRWRSKYHSTIGDKSTTELKYCNERALYLSARSSEDTLSTAFLTGRARA